MYIARKEDKQLEKKSADHKIHGIPVDQPFRKLGANTQQFLLVLSSFMYHLSLFQGAIYVLLKTRIWSHFGGV